MNRSRTPWRTRRLLNSLRRSDDPDVSLLQEELDARDKRLREAHTLIQQLQSELEEKRGEADALRRIGEATGSAFDQEAMLKVTAEIASQITGTDSCQIYLFDSAKEELTLRAADESFSSMTGKIRLKLGEGITGWVAKERKPVAVTKKRLQRPPLQILPRNERG